MILVDTSVLIDFLKGVESEGSAKFGRILADDLPFGISSYIFQELLQGAASEKEFALLKEYLETQRFYHLRHPVASFAEAAEIYMRCRRKGIAVRSTIDCLIAQTALENNLFLLHTDADFFAMSKVVPLRFW